MPWYFLPQEHVAPETESILIQAQVPAMGITIAKPRATAGLAFQARAEHLDEVLRGIGLGHCTFASHATDQDGVLLLEPAPGGAAQPDGAERFSDTADAFVANVTSRARAVRTENERQLPEFRARVAQLEADLFTAAARLRDVEEQLAVRAADDDALATRLRADFAAIGGDPRVASVGSTASQLIVETRALALASRPQRFLGRYRIAIGFSDANIRIEALDRLAEYPHPNVSARGIPYLGTHRDGLIRRLAKDQLAKVVRMLLDFLEEPPTGVMVPEMQPERWPELPPGSSAPAPAAAAPTAGDAPAVTVLRDAPATT